MEWFTWARFLSLARSKLRLCSANHRPGYWSNLPCDWLSTVWAYSEQETENRPWCWECSGRTVSVLSFDALVPCDVSSPVHGIGSAEKRVFICNDQGFRQHEPSQCREMTRYLPIKGISGWYLVISHKRSVPHYIRFSAFCHPSYVPWFPK